MGAAKGIKKKRIQAIKSSAAAREGGMLSSFSVWRMLRERRISKRSRVGERGRAASRDWQEDERRKKIASLEWGSESPEPSWDVGSPWWVLECPNLALVMAVAEKGDAGPDWAEVARQWGMFFKSAASAAKSSAKGRMYFHKEWEDMSQRRGIGEPWSAGRMARASACYEDDDFWGVMSGPFGDSIGQPHRRRERRREGTEPPKNWREAFGSFARPLWAAGISVQWPLTPKLDVEFEALNCIIQALMACGAKKAGICPGFRERLGERLELAGQGGARAVWEEFESEMGDSVRQKWALEAASRPEEGPLGQELGAGRKAMAPRRAL